MEELLVVERDGLRIGFIGLIEQCVLTQFPGPCNFTSSRNQRVDSDYHWMARKLQIS